MGRAIERATKAFHPDIDTTLLSPATHIINPDLSAVSGVPHCYWKVVGDSVVPMSRAEQAAQDIVTAQITLAAADAIATARAIEAVNDVKGEPPIDPTATLADRVRALEKKLFGV